MSESAVKERLEREHGEANVWNTDAMRKEFEITGFFYSIAEAVRRSDGTKGTLKFCDDIDAMDRYYYDFRPST